MFPLEGDATVSADSILLDHFLGTIRPERQARIATYLRSTQAEHGGWALFFRGPFDLGASVRAYFALKCAGDAPDAPHMARARAAILHHGGAGSANVFTRIQLALFGEIPWRAVPAMPVEIMLLPRWFPFHLSRVSYWSRTVVTPLLILAALRPRARNPRRVSVSELFACPPEETEHWGPPPPRSAAGTLFRGLDRLLHECEPLFPARTRRLALERCVAWLHERLNGRDGPGAIFPAMAYTLMALDALGEGPASSEMTTLREAIDRLVCERDDHAFCQACVSPVWDTGLALHALQEAGAPRPALEKAADWLARRQVLDLAGDWAGARPRTRPGGWAFQYSNPHYPDVDDTAVVALGLHRLAPARHADAVARAAEWILGMQSRNGGWGAFDADNDALYLNHIPFADHGALLDPPTADVTARCLCLLATRHEVPKAAAAALAFLRREQEADGSWFGRWGTNHLYGTWSVLAALNAAGVAPREPMVRRAVAWLLSRQREDGGWGEDCRSYWPGAPRGVGEASTPTQTAWALLGLMAAGEVNHAAVARGVDYLVRTQDECGRWHERHFNAVGFPRVFYLLYHGYRAYFPLWALARYRGLRAAGRIHVGQGL